MSDRLIEPYVRRDDISWWAGCRYVGSDRYIYEESAMTSWGARRLARRLAARARRLRDKGKLTGPVQVGDPR